MIGPTENWGGDGAVLSTDLLSEVLFSMEAHPLFLKQTAKEQRGGIQCLVDAHGDLEEYKSGEMDMCHQCKYKGKDFLVCGYLHFHCEHPSTPHGTDPWATVCDWGDEKCTHFLKA